MKNLVFVFLVSLSLFAQADDESFHCQNQSNNEESFILTQGYWPRNQAEANLEQIEGPLHFGGVWLQLENLEQGYRSTKYSYSTMNGSELILSIVLKQTCPRCSNDTFKKVISAKLVLNENEEINYTCN